MKEAIFPPHQSAYVREAVGVFDDLDSLQLAVRELEGSDFPRDAISVLGTPEEVKQKLGTSEVDSILLEDEPESPRQSPVRPEEQTIGASALIGCSAYIGFVAVALAASQYMSVPAALMLAALGGVCGGIIGAGIVAIISDRFYKNMRSQLAHGGLLLWVRTPDRRREAIACEILTHNHARHVHVHEI